MYKCSMYNNISPCQDGGFEVYNSMTKARISIDNIDFLSDVLQNGCDEATMNILVDNGFFVDENLDEESALRYVYNKRYFNSKALGLILLPTMACNFACPYCFEKGSSYLIKNENPDYFRIVERYIEKSALHFRRINLNFFGGEPLLKKEQIDKFTCRMQQLSAKYGFSLESTIVTNGSLIDKSVIEALLRVNCSLVQITIDGAKSQHDSTRIYKSGASSFDKLIEKIKLVASYIESNPTLRLLVRFNLSNTSLRDVQGTLQLFEPAIRKYISLMFRPVYSTKTYHKSNNNGYDDLDLFNQLGHQMGFTIYKNRRTYLSCEACGDTNVIHILPDLSLWKCINDLSFENAKMGYLKEDGEAEWDTNRVLAWYQNADFMQDEQCRKCSMSPDCLGGCIRNFILTGKHKCGSLQALSSPYRY